MLSATVVARTGMETDALSTAFYVMGVNRVLKYCRTHPDIKAVLATVPEDGEPRPVRIGNWD
jgi:thiamine biosynthesis lipoprotein